MHMAPWVIRRVDRRWFSNNRFSAVLDQLSKLKNKDGSQPFDPDQHFEDTAKTTQSHSPSLNSYTTRHEDAILDHSVDPPDANLLKSEVVEAINSLLEAQDVWSNSKSPESCSLDDETLTPAQRFYLENKELLINRMSEYSVSTAQNDWERATKDIQDDWRFYRDPVVRPDRGKLWPKNPLMGDSDGHEEERDSTEAGFTADGRLPSIAELVEFLEREDVEDLVAVDLEHAGRRDIGEYALIGTVKSYAHGDRVGKVACRMVNKLRIENIKTFSNATPGQEWIVVRLGSFVVHLMTSADRDRYSLEDLYAVQVPDPSPASLENKGIKLEIDSP